MLNIFIAIKIVFFIAVLYFFGWQFLRRVFKQNELYILIPASLYLGIFSYTFLLNLLAYVLGVQTSFFAAILVLLFVAASFLYLKASSRLIKGVSKKFFRLLIIFTVFINLFFVPIFFTRQPYDESWHGPLISTIVNGNFPVMKIEIPDSYAQYHYAFDLFAAGVSGFVGVSVQLASIIAQIMLFSFIFWLAFAVMKKFSLKDAAAMFSAWLIFFGGGLRYLAILKEVTWSSGLYFWNYIRQILDIIFSVKPMSPGFFHGYSVDTLAVFIYHRPMLYSVPLTLLLLWLAYLEYKWNKKIVYKIFLGLALGFLALSAETSFVLLAFGWGVWRLTLYAMKKVDLKMTLISIVTVALISSTVAVFQGGIITDSIIHREASGVFMPEYSQFELRAVPGLISYDNFFPINKPYSWAFFIVEWGILALLFPITIFYAYKKKNVFLYLMLSVIIIGSLAVSFIHYPERPGEMTRVNFVVLFFIAMLSGLLFARLWDSTKTKKIIAVMLLTAMMISPLFFNLKIFPDKLKTWEISIEKVDIDKEKKIADWAKESLPQDAAVLTAAPQAVTQLWGKLTFYGANMHDNRSIAKALPALLADNDLDYIKSKGVGYIYVNPNFSREYLASDFISENADRLDLLYTLDDVYQVYQIK